MDKQTSNDLVTGAAGSIEIDGKTYLAGQLTDADFFSLRKYILSQFEKKSKTYLASILDDIKDAPPDVKKMAIEAAVSQQPGGAKPNDAEMERMLLEPTGASFLIYLSVRKNHADVTLEDIKAKVNDDNVDEILGQLSKATGFADFEKK